MIPYKTSPFESKHARTGVDLIDRAGWRIPGTFTSTERELAAVRQHLGVADLSVRGKLNLKGAALPEFLDRAFGFGPIEPGTWVQVDNNGEKISLASLTSDECLILTPPGYEHEVKEFLTQNLADLFVTFVDRTGGLAALLLAGPNCRRVMSKLCALSFHPHDFPAFHLAQTSFAEIRATILRHDLGAIPAFELYFDRSYAAYLWAALFDAIHESHLQPLGSQTLDLLMNETTP